MQAGVHKLCTKAFCAEGVQKRIFEKQQESGGIPDLLNVDLGRSVLRADDNL